MTTLSRSYPAIQGEYEFEDEYEAELESELEDEYEAELEDEYESELEDEFEGEEEAFLGGLAGIAKSLLGEGELEAEDEQEFEFEYEAEAEMEAEGELEDEFGAEAEEEAEGFVNPVRRIHRDAETMAHLARQAAQTESEGEAEAFIGALVPLASRLIPRAAKLVARHAPALVRGATRDVRSLRRNPRTRRLVRALPVVLQRTAQSLADQAANGRPIDATTVVRTLGTMTGRVLRGPNGRRALRAVDVFNRRWHRRAHWAARQRRGSGYPARRRYRTGAIRPSARRQSRRAGNGRVRGVRRR